MGGHLSGVQGHKGTVASMGTAIFGRGSTTPTILRTGGTRMAVPTGRPGTTAKRPPSAGRPAPLLWQNRDSIGVECAWM